MGGLATAILIVNNVRDYETDVLVGKRTLVVRFGRTFGVVEYLAMIALSGLVPLIIVWRGLADYWVCLPLLTLPWLIQCATRVRHRTITMKWWCHRLICWSICGGVT